MGKRSKQHDEVQRILVEHMDSFPFLMGYSVLHENHRITGKLKDRDFEIDVLLESQTEEALIILELKLGDRDITDTTQGRGTSVIEQVNNYRDALREVVSTGLVSTA